MLQGPKPSPLVGNRYRKLQFHRNPIRFVSENRRRYGDIFGIAAGDASHIFAFGAESNRRVLTNPTLFHTVFDYVAPPSPGGPRQRGIIEMNDAEHKDARRLLNPGFDRSKHPGFIADTVRFAREKVSGWKPGSVIDLTAEMRELTLRIACKSMFGIDLGGRAAAVADLVRRMLETPVISPWLAFLPWKVSGTPLKRVAEISDRLGTELNGMIDSKLKQGPHPGNPDLMDILIERYGGWKGGLDRHAICGHMRTMVVAGHETTSSSLAWLVTMISALPGLLETVRKDTDALNLDRPLDMPALAAFAGLDHAFKETLRLFPPGPNTHRISTGGFSLQGMEFGGRTMVTISKFVSHRNPEVFRNPSRFEAGRWESISPGPYDYFPFGIGPKMCMGGTMAEIETKLIVAVILQERALKRLDDQPVDYQVKMMMSPKNPIRFSVLEGRGGVLLKRGIGGSIRELVELPR